MSRPRRELRFDDWDVVIADIERLEAGGYDHADRGNWSLGQICDHLAVVLNGALDGFPKTMPWPVQKLLKWMFLPSMLRHRPIKFRAAAPKFARPPEKEAIEDTEGVAHLTAAIERFRQPDVQYVPHLVFGKLTKDEWNQQQLWHCEHHLSFLLPRDSQAS